MTSTQDELRRRDDGPVKSVGKALFLLEWLATTPVDSRTLANAAQEIGVSKSSALAILRTLQGHGLVVLDRDRRRYSLGTTLIRLGEITRAQFRITEIAEPLMRELSQKTGRTVRLAVRNGYAPLFIHRIDGVGAVRFETTMGNPECPTTTAAGKVILASLSSQELTTCLADLPFVKRTPRSITDPATLTAELELVRASGFSVDREEDLEGVVCVSSGYYDRLGTCLGAMSMTFLRADVTDGQVDEMGELVTEYARKLSAELGSVR